MIVNIRIIIPFLLTIYWFNPAISQSNNNQTPPSENNLANPEINPGLNKTKSEIFARETAFSNYLYNNQFTNPAYTGIGNKVNVYYGFTSNLPFQKDYKTLTHLAMVDYAIGKKQNHSLGLAFLNTHYSNSSCDIYDLKTIQLNYSGRIHLYKDHYLRLGFGLLFERQTICWDCLTFGDMIDPNYGFIYETNESQIGPTRSYFSNNAGLLYYFKYVQFSTSVIYINSPRQGWIGTEKKPLSINSSLAGYIPINKWMLNPYFTLDFLQKQEGSQMKTTLFTGGLLAFAPQYAYAGVAFSNLAFTRLSLGVIGFDRIRIGVDADVFLNQTTASYFGPLKTLQMHIRYVTKK